MHAVIIRKPNILSETTEMLFRFCNGITYEDDQKQLRRKYLSCFSGSEAAFMLERIDTIGRISAEVCADLEPNDPKLADYFRIPEEEKDISAACCPAAMLALSFLDSSINGFDEAIENAKLTRRRLFNGKFKLLGINPFGLQVSTIETSNLSFIKQVDELSCLPAYKWMACKIFENFDEYMNDYADLIRPYAEKLETALQAHHELWDGLYDYWEEYFQSHSVEDFRRALTNTSGSCDDELELHVNLNIMACRYLKSDFERFAGTKTVNVFIGSAINANFRINNPSADMSSVCDVFRALGEKGKFDLLCRLAKKRSHCREIAAELDINPGTVSKMLSALYALGLVNSEHEDNKSYYTTNVEAFSSFLSIADRMVRSQQE